MNSTTAIFYNRISRFYSLIDLFLVKQKKRLIHEINELTRGNLLEIGVGTGKHLKECPDHNITGIDISSKMLHIAKSQNIQNLKVIQMDGRKLDLPDHSFDYVVLSHVLSISDDSKTMINEAKRVLKSNGKLILLNHFSPSNFLGFIDWLFQPISKLFHFKSYFKLKMIDGLDDLKCNKALTFGFFNYYQLLIFEKN